MANGAESEPASRKDETLIRAAPHLILDGLQLAAEAVGASEAYLCLHQGAAGGIGRALRERAASGQDLIGVALADTPPRFLAGQESAVVSRLGGGPAIPAFTPPRVTERGLGGRPTLVRRRRCAHLALIATTAPAGSAPSAPPRSPGACSPPATPPPADAGSSRRRSARRQARLLGPGDQAQAWLIGGYHGSWVAPDTLLTLDDSSLRGVGAAVGAGVAAALPRRPLQGQPRPRGWRATSRRSRPGSAARA